MFVNCEVFTMVWWPDVSLALGDLDPAEAQTEGFTARTTAAVDTQLIQLSDWHNKRGYQLNEWRDIPDVHYSHQSKLAAPVYGTTYTTRAGKQVVGEVAAQVEHGVGQLPNAVHRPNSFRFSQHILKLSLK